MATGAGDFVLRNGAFTPAQANVVLWRAEEHKIPFRHSDIRVKMKRGREQDQLASMDPQSLSRMLPCLDAKQREAVQR